MSRPLRDRELRLLVALREYETAGAAIDIGDLERRSGYKPATLRTYVSKRLDGRLLRRRADDTYVVAGASACSEDDFADLMSQKLAAGGDFAAEINCEAEWNRAIDTLAEMAIEHGYRLDEVVAEKFLDLVR